jgi:putative DNA primase/helicase
MVRFHPALEYWAAADRANGRPVLIGRFPAMLAKALSPKGSFVQLHKTYLTADGHKANVPVVKKTERGVGINGFAVALMPVAGDSLGFAEGIESALGAAMVRRIPVWSCLSGPSMAAMDLPEHLREQVSRVLIFADHDPLKALPSGPDEPKRLRSAGSHYAEQLAQRMRDRGKRVLVLKASRVGFDMADYWVQRQAGALLA